MNIKTALILSATLLFVVETVPVQAEENEVQRDGWSAKPTRLGPKQVYYDSSNHSFMFSDQNASDQVWIELVEKGKTTHIFDFERSTPITNSNPKMSQYLMKSKGSDSIKKYWGP